MKILRIVASGFLAIGLAFGCGGTTNNDSKQSWNVCSVNSDCTLASNACCTVCGSPTLDDMDAVNKKRTDDHFQAVCPKPLPCPQCATANSPNLVATCGGGTCRAVDVREDAATACTVDDDCRLRVTACCECGGSIATPDLIAINRSRESAYTAYVCDPERACLACAPIYPTNVDARCASDGHCEVRPAALSPCSLPFDPGPCEAAMPVFAFVDGDCVGRVYGGCQGNDNRFSTIEECMAACKGEPDPNGCSAGRVARNACLSCGPAGGCGRHSNVCAKICQSNSDCDGTLWYCANGACEVGGCI